MIRRFISSALDECTGLMLLHNVLRFADRTPVTAESDWEAFSYQAVPQDLFAPTPEPARLERLRESIYETASANVDDLGFRSPVATQFPANNIVHLRHWACRDTGDYEGVRPVCIVLDGLVQFGFGNARLFAKRLNHRGVDVVGMVLPFNHKRTPPGYRPGQLLVGGNVAHVLAAMRQAVLDTWALIRCFQAEGRPVHLVGISFGGWTVAMTSVVASGLASVSAVAPPVDLLRVLSEGGVILRAAKRGLDLTPAQLTELQPVARLLNPSAWQPQLAGRDIVLHAAEYDRFVPTPRIKLLAERWNAQLVCHHVGHIELTSIPLWLSGVANDLLGIVTRQTL